MATLGKNIIVMWDDGGTLVAIAASKSCTFRNVSEVKEISSPSSSKARDYVSGRTSWNVSCRYLVSNVCDMLKVGNTYTLNILNEDGQTGLQGTAILVTCEISATQGDLAYGQFSFQGSGELIDF